MLKNWRSLMKRKVPMVIAIAGVSGGGKTTIATYLKGKLPNSKTIYFDDYDFDGPADIIEWIEKGGDPDEWDLSPLISDLGKLNSETLDFIIVDFPFAYLHRQISNLIDFAVFIDTPLDVAMARRISRDFANGSAEDILLDLDNYLSGGRKGYLAMLNTTKPNSDLIVDGTLPVSEIAGIIAKNFHSID
jgi:uridine kinase